MPYYGSLRHIDHFDRGEKRVVPNNRGNDRASDKAASGRVSSTVLGYPRIGRDRALKKATEAYWAETAGAAELLGTAAATRETNWSSLRAAGLDQVPCNDFSLYDHVLDTAVLLGAIPARHRGARPNPRRPDDEQGDDAWLQRYFAMARGTAEAAPLEMTKWFDTNYHYLVPELAPGTEFSLDARKPLAELSQARSLGLDARPVLVGPVTFLLLSKPAAGAPAGFVPLSLLDDVLPLYGGLLARLHAAGAGWVQFDEPALACDQPADVLDAVRRCYQALSSVPSRPDILVTSYFAAIGEALPVLQAAPIEGVGLDFTGSARANLDALRAAGGLPGKRLVAGVVDGRNVWAADLDASLALLAELRPLAEELVVSSSCSLLHVPVDVAPETGIDPAVRRWLAFADQKVTEIVTLARGLHDGAGAIGPQLAANRDCLAARASSPLTRVVAVRQRVAAIAPQDDSRATPYQQRSKLQDRRLGLPPLPTTTIGSFPQTPAIRAARAAWRNGRLDDADYRQQMRTEIDHVVELQDDVGLDVLVHGEPERADMVHYFAEQLAGVVSTQHGWVQSYGTRYVRPPIIAGDVSRLAPMTVEWWRYAQSLTSRPVKAMLTGPVTMLRWSFVRDDTTAQDVAVQLALALRDEVADLETAGAAIIQVDEPALREGLPLRRAARAEYLAWATRAFRLATCGVRPETQIHTHMCYAEFGDILDAIVSLDSDVISLEAARSGMAVVDELADADYPAAVGPGVYDIHSPRIPDDAELAALLGKALARLPAERLWVNPDCGLKTRTEAEVVPALRAMVTAARRMRQTRAEVHPASD